MRLKLNSILHCGSSAQLRTLTFGILLVLSARPVLLPAWAENGAGPESGSSQPVGDVEAVSILSTEPIVRAKGVLFLESTGGTVERAAAIENRGNSRWDIKVPLSAEDRTGSARLTVVVTSASGRILATRIRRLSDTDAVDRSDFVGCQADPGDEIATLGTLDVERLKALVGVREKKIELLSGRVRSLLTPEMIEKVSALEEQFGLDDDTPLSAQASVQTLARRLTALQAVMKRSDTMPPQK